MLDVKFLVENTEQVIENIARRGKYKIDFHRIIGIYKERNELIGQIDSMRAEKNTASMRLSQIDKKSADFQNAVKELKKISVKEKELADVLRGREEELRNELLQIPNLLDEKVPAGKDERDNLVVKEWGEKREFSFKPMPHWDIGEKTGILDIKRAAKIAGSRFVMNVGRGAALERALINFMLDTHTKEFGYTEIVPPFMANSDSFIGTGQLPKFKEDLFKCEGWDYYLIPTAEVPLTNIYRNEIIPESKLPIFVTAYSPCFRSEAGSWGKDTRGMIRVHQFNKVELVKFTKPEDSEAEHAALLSNAEAIIQRLGIPYRVVLLSAGDTSFTSAITYDIELWMSGMNVYKEASSVSNFKDFQARRANIRYKEKGTNKTRFIHTLNGSGLAVGRLLAAVIEYYQNEDGTITIPPVLQKYL